MMFSICDWGGGTENVYEWHGMAHTDLVRGVTEVLNTCTLYCKQKISTKNPLAPAPLSSCFLC